ncbi:PP2C family protein-serine/threonine phosphatase [Tichowtungia aerotolerans]|uniref:SpoIIE family protein phosphatase n=1 Tax=Tichowtungia aerotolerans TaxID=2697043 RepID=A0A6P1MEP3_9BACT|nr:GAF domain-containing SpoIIE family protein phosphatase [Tichowtungia aerotolerans]QHI69555.1 SpoIIE family protein phosphatase [Tichowtungia aerotolerans]
MAELLHWIVALLASAFEVALIVFLCFTYQNRKTLRKENRRMRKEREVIFEFVHQIGEVFADAEEIDMDTLLKRILFFSTKTNKAAAGAIYLFNKDRDRLFARAVSGIFPPLYDAESVKTERLLAKSQHLETLVKERSVNSGEGLVGAAAAVGTGIIIEDGEVDARVPTYKDAFLQIHSLLIVPMRFGNEVLGVVALVNRIDGSPFTAGDLNLLQAMADQACVPIHYAGLRDALEHKKQLDRDLHAAQQIQASLLPQTLPHLDGVQLSAFNLPAYDIGGDYYDLIQIDEEHLGIAIADVSGKGIGGAMMMAVCQGVLRTRAGQEQSPARMLSELNRVLSNNLAEDMFITMLYMALNIQTRELRFARAGHERPLICRGCSNRNRELQALDSPGIAIGLTSPEVFDAVIEDMTIQLESGDEIIVYTDGITEALNEEGEEWGLENLSRLIKASPQNPESLLRTVQNTLTRYVGARQQYDDMTMFALKIN